MKGEKMLITFTIVFCGVLPILGANLFLYFIDRVPGYEINASKSDYALVNAAMVAGILIAYLLIIWRKKKHDNIPAADERTLLVMKNYFLYVLYFIFILSGTILLVLFFLGVQSIAIGAIFAYFTFLIIVIGAGALIVSKL